MPKFDYTISTLTGVKSHGTLFANSVENAHEKLREKNQIIIALTERKSHPYFWQKPHLSIQEKLTFVKNMATMLRVGLPITEALQIIIDQTQGQNQRRMFENILERVRTGQNLSKSLNEYQGVFSEIFVNMISTGEESGTLEEVFGYLDRQLEKEYELRKKVVSAFVYPGVIIGMTVILAVGIAVFIMPEITKVFESLKVDLPLITRMMIGASTALVEKPLIVAGVAVGGIMGIMQIFRIKMLKPIWHRLVLYIPIFGKLLVYSSIARIARTMTSLLQSGVPIIKALDITGAMITNTLYKNALLKARNKVEQGGKLGESLSQYPRLFPTMMHKMMYIGEKTGSLETTTERIAELYEQNVDNLTKNLSVLLEPLLLIGMGIMIGGIALSIILPIYQLPNLIG